MARPPTPMHTPDAEYSDSALYSDCVARILDIVRDLREKYGTRLLRVELELPRFRAVDEAVLVATVKRRLFGSKRVQWSIYADTYEATTRDRLPAAFDEAMTTIAQEPVAARAAVLRSFSFEGGADKRGGLSISEDA